MTTDSATIYTRISDVVDVSDFSRLHASAQALLVVAKGCLGWMEDLRQQDAGRWAPGEAWMDHMRATIAQAEEAE